MLVGSTYMNITNVCVLNSVQYMYNFVCLPSLVLSQICRRAGAAPKNIQNSSGVGSRRELQTCSVAFNTGVYILHFLCKRGQKLSDTQKGGGDY